MIGNRWGRRWLAVAGLAVYLTNAIVNVGIIAIDDYFEVMAKVLPAAAHTPQQVIAATGIRNPIPDLLHLESSGWRQRWAFPIPTTRCVSTRHSSRSSAS